MVPYTKQERVEVRRVLASYLDLPNARAQGMQGRKEQQLQVSGVEEVMRLWRVVWQKRWH
jgi:hypothetical protein